MTISDTIYSKYNQLRKRSYWRKIKNKEWEKLLLRSSLKSNSIDFNHRDNSIIINDLNLKLEIKNCFVLESVELFRNLYSYCGFIFENSNNEIIARNDNLSFEIQTVEDVFILNEIFFNNHYNYDIKDEHIVIDIGMNVGFASIYFADKTNTARIYGFEPLPQTYNQALRNISLNPDINYKIKSFNLGLGSSNFNKEIDYNYKWKGHIGQRNFKEELKKFDIDESDLIKQEIKIIDFREKLLEIVSENKNSKIVLKIDCEGAEYEIIKSIDFNTIGKDISLIMIEWHDKGPSALKDKLLQNNFSVFCLHNSSSNAGMIYAAK